jgi:hypothetical protein
MVDKKLNTAINILPFVFMLHNIEEAVSMQDWIEKSPMKISYSITTNQFIAAVALFTVMGFIAVFAKWLYKDEAQFFILIAGFSGMLLLNVFIPHLIAALVFRMYVPGLITAILINFPLTIYILWHIYKSPKPLTKNLIFIIIAGGIIGIALAYLFLLLGKLFVT